MDRVRRGSDPHVRAEANTKKTVERQAENLSGSPWKAFLKLRPRARVLLAGLVVGLLYLYIGGSDGFYVQWRLSREIGRLEHQNALIREQNERMRQHIVRLKSDLSYLERIARERYGMARPGERVYRIIPWPGNGKGGGDE
jgi:cell division protein FtsB